MKLEENYIDQLKEYLQSGNMLEIFEYFTEEHKYEILDFLEKLIELGEIADQTATQLIFKNTQLANLFNKNNQK